MLQKTKYALCDVGIIFNTYGVEQGVFCVRPRLGMNFNTRVGGESLLECLSPKMSGIIFNTYAEEGMVWLLLRLRLPDTWV